MSGPPFTLFNTREAENVLGDLSNGGVQYAAKLKKVRKALRLLEQHGPRRRPDHHRHPGTHP